MCEEKKRTNSWGWDGDELVNLFSSGSTQRFRWIMVDNKPRLQIVYTFGPEDCDALDALNLLYNYQQGTPPSKHMMFDFTFKRLGEVLVPDQKPPSKEEFTPVNSGCTYGNPDCPTCHTMKKEV